MERSVVIIGTMQGSSKRLIVTRRTANDSETHTHTFSHSKPLFIKVLFPLSAAITVIFVLFI